MAFDTESIPRIRRDTMAVGLDPQTISTAIWTQLLELHTAIPGIIDKFDAEKQTAEVRPAIKMLHAPDTQVGGKPQWYECCLCVDVPVVFPGNANYMLTFPVEQGDECLLVFAERSIDHWFTEGGVQEQAQNRQHDASDAICIMGLRSQPNKIENFDNENLQLRTADGDTVVTLDKDGTITAGVNGATMTIENGRVTVHADNIKLDGDVQVTGNAKIHGNVTGQGSADFAGDVTAESRVSLATHVHTGVMSGGGTSGPPV